ncbi:hypothetical protein CAEBREN_10224 [Caenorhabditis brenneri]|uniref:Uncharacterized protein n=1 Tax=Caenorhabditis brenneri TaxID=135651 RepID=G0PFB5_CAEBE|nr:hypothetical protein CAEBREN_10224 [Caenorhabditis brenneri]
MATGLSCYEGEGTGAAVVSSEEYLMCKMEKDVNGEKKVYSGTAEVHDLTRGTCLLIYDNDAEILKAHCYCATNNCNKPGVFNPQ